MTPKQEENLKKARSGGAKRYAEMLNERRKEQENKEESIAVVMCDSAFGDTPDELQLMAKRIKEICATGSVVHIIPFDEK
jgi:dihydrodipicolinate reductase